FHARDQRVLPVHALQLPDPERDEAGERRRQRDGEDRACDRPARRRDRARGHGGLCSMSCMSWVAGIMLVFMWCITHSDPASTIATSTTVKMSASRFQPPS